MSLLRERASAERRERPERDPPAPAVPAGPVLAAPGGVLEAMGNRVRLAFLRAERNPPAARGGRAAGPAGRDLAQPLPGPRGDGVPPGVQQALSGPGRPLEPAVRRDMERRFGHDFSRVRVHTDAQAGDLARAVRARAYTVGWDVVFAEGHFSPHSREGSRLLTHELAHVIQQQRGGGTPELNPDAAHERDADAAANAAVSGEGRVSVRGATGIGIARAPLDLTGRNGTPDLSAWSNRTPDLSVWSVAKLEAKLEEIEKWRGSRISTSPQSRLADVAAAQIRSQLEQIALLRAEAEAVAARMERTMQDDEEEERKAPPVRPQRPVSLSLLKPEEMCLGHCYTDEDIYREYNEAKARSDRERKAEALNQRASWINEAVKNRDSTDILHLFERADPAERIALQWKLDMEKVIDVMDDFEAARFGTLGPVIAGQDKLNRKRAAYLKQVIDDFLPAAPDRAEVFVLYVFSGVYDDDAYSIFAELANHGRISELLDMPNVAKLIKARGLETWGFNEPEESWTAIFPGIGRGLKHFVKDDRPGKYRSQQSDLPREYQRILSQMEMAEFESSLTFRNTIIAAIDEVTFGVPHGAVDLVRGTASGIGDIAQGEYGKAGEKLSGAAMVLLTHVAVKAWSGARRAIGGTRGTAGLKLTPEAQAAVDRMVARVGRGGVEKAAALIQKDGRAAALVIEHGEAGVYALLEAEGDVAAAASKLSQHRPAALPGSGPAPDVIQGGGQSTSPPKGRLAVVGPDNTVGPPFQPKAPPKSDPPGGGASGQPGTGRVANDNAVATVVEEKKAASGGGGSPMMVRKIVRPPGKPSVSPVRTGENAGPGNEQGQGRRPDRNPIQERTVKETPPPEDTHSVRPGPPGAKQQPLPLEAGNFAEKNFNHLKEAFEGAGIPSKKPISEPIPSNARKFKIEGQRGYSKGREPEIDALDWNSGTVIEIKPHNLYEQGLAEAKAYASDMNKLHPLPPEKLPDGTLRPRSWQPKCVTYDGDAMRAYWERVRQNPEPGP